MDYNLIIGSTHHAVRVDGPVGDAGTSTIVYLRYNGIQLPTISGDRIRDTGLSGSPNFVKVPNFDL
jgi:hypothetical protein